MGAYIFAWCASAFLLLMIFSIGFSNSNIYITSSMYMLLFNVFFVTLYAGAYRAEYIAYDMCVMRIMEMEDLAFLCFRMESLFNELGLNFLIKDLDDTFIASDDFRDVIERLWKDSKGKIVLFKALRFRSFVCSLFKCKISKTDNWEELFTSLLHFVVEKPRRCKAITVYSSNGEKHYSVGIKKKKWRKWMELSF